MLDEKLCVIKFAGETEHTDLKFVEKEYIKQFEVSSIANGSDTQLYII